MNSKRLKEAADWIDEVVDDSEFNMGRTCGCIAGHTAIKEGKTDFAYSDWDFLKKWARKFFGLTVSEAEALFMPRFIDQSLGGKTLDKKLAVRTMRRAARIGKIIWR